MQTNRVQTDSSARPLRTQRSHRLYPPLAAGFANTSGTDRFVMCALAGAMRRVRSISPRQIRMEWRNVALALVWVPMAPMSC